MPLLNPAKEKLPFGVALELWDGGVNINGGKSSTTEEIKGPDLYEVDYVLYGHGKVGGRSDLRHVMQSCN